MLSGKIFLTGGTGSLGTALLRWATELGWPCQFTIYSRDEVKQGELRSRFPDHHYVLGDIRDLEWLSLMVRGHDSIIHAAAYKQVPAAEVNVGEAIETNVLGSRNVALAAVKAGIPRVLGISTDKACQPVNAYGETKALMEKLFQQATLWGETQFNLVRYGNVLGSRGSIVPLFKQQSESGWITVTDPDMTRFWMTLADAVDVVLAGMDESVAGTVLVPKVKASTLAVLAFAVAPRAGIKTIGIRAGEKIHEKLLHNGESMHADDLGDYFRIYPAYTHYQGNLPAGYEYTSETAPQISVPDLREMLDHGGEERVRSGWHLDEKAPTGKGCGH